MGSRGVLENEFKRDFPRSILHGFQDNALNGSRRKKSLSYM